VQSNQGEVGGNRDKTDYFKGGKPRTYAARRGWKGAFVDVAVLEGVGSLLHSVVQEGG